MRSASCSLVRELGRLSVTSATMLPRLVPSWPTPKSAPAMPTAVCVAIWREIVVGRLQLLDQSGVHGHLAARHAPGVHFGHGQDVDFPGPFLSIGTEYRGLRDEPAGNGLHALHLGGILVEGALLLRLGHHL